MAYSYDEPFLSHLTIATATFSTQTPVTLPATAVAALAHAGTRLLQNAAVLGVSGVVGTAGAGTISIGDGTTAARYGTITFDATATAGTAVKASVVLTEEGFHMGTSNAATTPDTFVLTFSGSLVANHLQIMVGHY